MKKRLHSILALLLAAVLAMNLFGCGKTEDKAEETTTVTQETTEAASESTTAVSEETTEASQDEEDPWADATYTEDREFGEGQITVAAEVTLNDHSVTFTLHTDKETLGDALLEQELIAGEDGQYGLYVTEVNGITADYDKDQAYWAFYKDGEYLQTGVDSTEIADGEHYELVYTKG